MANAQANAPVKPSKQINTQYRVRATQAGFYNGTRRRVGEEFVLAKPEHFSAAWMTALADFNKPKGGADASKEKPLA